MSINHPELDKLISTVKSRMLIGFPKNFEEWRNSPAIYSDHSLTILGHPVMEDWESPYMKKLADIAASKKGIILEVGFGMGISAGFIQQNNIEKHIIIEANHSVANRARDFAKHSCHQTEVLEGMWQEEIKNIPDESIDGILFDTYPLSADEIHRNAVPFFNAANKKLKDNGIFTYYSDEQANFSSGHLSALISAGFKKDKISSEIVAVETPKGCKYWISKTMMAPIVKKG